MISMLDQVYDSKGFIVNFIKFEKGVSAYSCISNSLTCPKDRNGNVTLTKKNIAETSFSMKAIFP